MARVMDSASLIVTGVATAHGATVPVSPAPAARPHPALLSVVGNLAAITVSGANFRSQAQVAIRVYLRATPDSSWAMMGRTSARTGADGLFAVTLPAPASPSGLSLLPWGAHVLATAVDRRARLELSAQNTVDDGWGL